RARTGRDRRSRSGRGSTALFAVLAVLALAVAAAPRDELTSDLLRLPASDDLARLDGEVADNGVSLVDDCHPPLLSDFALGCAVVLGRGLGWGLGSARPSATSPASLIPPESVGWGAMPPATVSTVASASIATPPASTMSVTCGPTITRPSSSP